MNLLQLRYFLCSSTFSCAYKRENCASPTIKDVFQSTRHIKKPVYRLPNSQAEDQKPVNKVAECTKTKSVSVAFHGENCSSEAKHDISGKYCSASKSRTVERGSSKHLNTHSAYKVPRRPEETSKGSLDEKSSQRSQSKLKKQLMSPLPVSAEQKEQAQNILKRKSRAEETPRRGKDSNAIKTKEPSKFSFISRDYARQKRIELVKERRQRHPEINLKATSSLCTQPKTPSAFPTKQSFTSAKHTTSVSSSNVEKSVISIPGNVTSVSQNATKSSSALQQMRPPVRFNFKIPKILHPRPIDSTSENIKAISTNVNFKQQTDLSNSGALMSKSKQETVQQAHSHLDVTPSFSSEGRDKKSSLSGEQLPATFDAVTEPWHDEVLKSIIYFIWKSYFV